MMEAFAVPPRVYSRKRKAADDAPRGFLSGDAYDAWSIAGDAFESTWYHAEEQRRQLAAHATVLPPEATAVTAPSRAAADRGDADKAPPRQAVGSVLAHMASVRPVKHLACLQYDRKARERTPGLVQAENMARRLSALSVAEHLEYMQLQKKRVDAQRRDFRHNLEIIACKDEAARYTAVPPFVEDWAH
ncbi:hypothetical protein P43SY_009923 [Pythium insidiosum]|uniref:Uncharacterized protein n=1 Tax=Pythium insidiosum TaxID=114742 RepID=A0AAD5M1Z8_PYTIN|nr:hypothetical protein P43SY_009923 [Pythium insidiosum]